MVEEKEQAKQLDSVTDKVEEKTLDAAKAQEAMGALSVGKATRKVEAVEKLKFVQQDVDLICDELDVTEETAKRALREAAVELGASKREGQALVVCALKKLVTS